MFESLPGKKRSLLSFTWALLSSQLEGAPLSDLPTLLIYSFILKKIFFMWTIFNVFISIYLFFWPHCVACGILVPQPGFEFMPFTLLAQSISCYA